MVWANVVFDSAGAAVEGGCANRVVLRFEHGGWVTAASSEAPCTLFRSVPALRRA